MQLRIDQPAPAVRFVAQGHRPGSAVGQAQAAAAGQRVVGPQHRTQRLRQFGYDSFRAGPSSAAPRNRPMPAG